MTELVKYEAAKVALAEARSTDEVKNIHNIASAMKAYARQANDRQMEVDASDIRIRAERRLGAMIREQGEAGQLAQGRRTDLGRDATQVGKATLAEVGIDKHLADRARKMASIPEEDFEETLAKHREEQEAVTTRTMEALSRKGTHVSHNSGDNEWYTPNQYIEAAHATMGGVDLDPASSAVANTVVSARRIFTIEDDGLTKEWAGRVWMNPPYASDLVGRFIEKLAVSVESGAVTEAIVLVNNATETKWFARLASVSFMLCFPNARIKFWKPESDKAAPLQGQVIAYIGNNDQDFNANFKQFGIITEILK